MEEKDRLDSITRRIIGAAIEVHRRLGPGLLESAYEICLAFELRHLGFNVEVQKPRLSGKRVGLLMNFHVHVLKNGLKRIVNDFPDSASSAISAVSADFKGKETDFED